MRIDNHGVGLEVDVDGPGDGPPVVLLHGISSCSGTYDFLVPELPAHRLYFRGWHLIHDSQTQRSRYLDEVHRFLTTYAPA